MKLGLMLLDLGVTPGNVQMATQAVRTWMNEIMGDPRFAQKPRDTDFESDQMQRFLIGTRLEGVFHVTLVDREELVQRLGGEQGADPQVIVNIFRFIEREVSKL